MRISDWGSDVCSSGLLVNWFGDSLDGSLARWRGIERPAYGYFVDHSVDGVAIVLIVGGIGASPYFRLDVALFGAVGYLLLAIRSEEHTSELQSLMRISYAVFCLKKKTQGEQRDSNSMTTQTTKQYGLTLEIETHTT